MPQSSSSEVCSHSLEQVSGRNRPDSDQGHTAYIWFDFGPQARPKSSHTQARTVTQRPDSTGLRVGHWQADRQVRVSRHPFAECSRRLLGRLSQPAPDGEQLRRVLPSLRTPPNSRRRPCAGEALRAALPPRRGRAFFFVRADSVVPPPATAPLPPSLSPPAPPHPHPRPTHRCVPPPTFKLQG